MLQSRHTAPSQHKHKFNNAAWSKFSTGGLNSSGLLPDERPHEYIPTLLPSRQAEKAAKAAGIPVSARTIIHLDLSSLDSVRQFVDNFNKSGRPLDVLVANAALYLPTAKEPTYTADGYEISVATNHLVRVGPVVAPQSWELC